LGQVGTQGPQFDAEKTVRFDVVSDPAADNGLALGQPAERSTCLLLAPLATGRAVLPSPSGLLSQRRHRVIG